MPNRDVHLRVGAVSGGAYATYHAWGQPGPYVLAEAAGGLVGGIGGGLFPDWIDTPCSPRHRAEAHSLTITCTLGHFINPPPPQWHATLRPGAQPYAQLRAASPALAPPIRAAGPESIRRSPSRLVAGL